MCQACMPPDSTTAPISSPGDDTAVATRDMSLLTFIALITGALMGCAAIMGTLLWLVLWLQPQFAAL